eukprot:5643008-Prymnesium_polylepis.1
MEDDRLLSLSDGDSDSDIDSGAVSAYPAPEAPPAAPDGTLQPDTVKQEVGGQVKCSAEDMMGGAVSELIPKTEGGPPPEEDAKEEVEVE